MEHWKIIPFAHIGACSHVNHHVIRDQSVAGPGGLGAKRDNK